MSRNPGDAQDIVGQKSGFQRSKQFDEFKALGLEYEFLESLAWAGLGPAVGAPTDLGTNDRNPLAMKVHRNTSSWPPNGFRHKRPKSVGHESS